MGTVRKHLLGVDDTREDTFFRERETLLPSPPSTAPPSGEGVEL